ncbi:MAG: hypothetical protein DI563_02885 [Variovorax paradoxus]|uniref:Zeta toxin domain-containing protein n=1 Tax=Variovorax paradoxus TaxID=34073 RepID=A0A2W5QRV5_VARPD|nr:MAG: hypothetical protein DI563_02885 [Variovorax paradoxus]
MARSPLSTRSVEPRQPSERELRRLYERCVSQDLASGAQPAVQPAAMIITGQPGAGLTFATVQLRRQLLETVATAAHVSMNRLCAYHPIWANGGDIAPQTAERVSEDCASWFNRLVKDAQKQRHNLIAEVEATQIEAVPTLAGDLRRSGYMVQAVFVATSREDSHVAMMARYEMRRRHGLAVDPPSIKAHDFAVGNVVDVLGRMEFDRSVDGLRVIASNGDHIYEGRLDGDKWDRPPRASATLGALLDKTPTTKEMVRTAMRWETLFQRLGTDPTVPREVASQVLQWRNEAIGRCEQEPSTAIALQWAREAGAFRVMNRFEFLKEFPHHERAVQALGIAATEAERFPKEQADRLMVHARENIAQRIERGDMARIAARQKSQDAKAQTREAGPPTSDRSRNPRTPEGPSR